MSIDLSKLLVDLVNLVYRDVIKINQPAMLEKYSKLMYPKDEYVLTTDEYRQYILRDYLCDLDFKPVGPLTYKDIILIIPDIFDSETYQCVNDIATIIRENPVIEQVVDFKHYFDYPNSDMRGTQPIDWFFTWNQEISLKNPTVQDIIKALYAIRSHKMDDNYELIFIDETTFTFNMTGDVMVNISCDYGS